MSKIIKSPWFWFAVIAVIIVAGYFIREQYLNGTGLFSASAPEDAPSSVDIKPASGGSGNSIEVTTEQQSTIPFQAGY